MAFHTQPRKPIEVPSTKPSRSAPPPAHLHGVHWPSHCTPPASKQQGGEGTTPAAEGNEPHNPPARPDAPMHVPSPAGHQGPGGQEATVRAV